MLALAMLFGLAFTLAGSHQLIKEAVFEQRDEHLIFHGLTLLSGLALLAMIPATL